jgi:hypothetical protein
MTVATSNTTADTANTTWSSFRLRQVCSVAGMDENPVTGHEPTAKN